MKNTFLLFIIFLTLSSCSSTRNLVYFSNLDSSEKSVEQIKNKPDQIIQSDDLLSITISSLNSESNALFNNGVLQTAGSAGASTVSARSYEGYLVDRSGNINFPVIGTIMLGGLTKEKAIEKITVKIKEYIKNPVINIRFLNFKITVVGEVNHPSTFIVVSEKINLMEALGQAGDLTPYGKRSNLLIIREENGVRSTARVNLNDKNALSSPYYYLHQNDILYVEPIKAKILQGSPIPIFVPLISAVVAIISLIIVSNR